MLEWTGRITYKYEKYTPLERRLLETLASCSPYPFEDITRAYDKDKSFDKLIRLINLSLESGYSSLGATRL